MKYFLIISSLVFLYFFGNHIANKILDNRLRKILMLSKGLEKILLKYVEAGYEDIQIFKGITFSEYLNILKSNDKDFISLNIHYTNHSYNIIRKIKHFKTLNKYLSEVKPVIRGLILPKKN